MSRDLQARAHTFGVQLQLLYAGTDAEIDTAFSTLASKSGAALLVNADPFFFIRRAQITALASRHAVPAICWINSAASSGSRSKRPSAKRKSRSGSAASGLRR